MKYRNRPQVDEVEAVQWAGTASRERRRSADRIVAWVREHGGEAEYDPKGPRIGIPAGTITGKSRDWDYAAPGDYVVMGGVIFVADLPEDQRAALSFWVCEADTFKARYEAAT